MSDTADRDDEGQRPTAASAAEGETRRRRAPRLRAAFKRIGIFLTITAVLLVFVEGCGSALIVV
jgi:hypothetical protein